MADDNRKRGAADRRRVAAGEPYEVSYFARKHGLSKDEALKIIKKAKGNRAKANALGRVDGFNQDEAECKGYEGSVVLRGLLASERDAFEALEFADGLLDACPRLVEYFRKECRSIDRV